MDFLTQLWQRALAADGPLTTEAALLIGAVAFGVTVVAWRGVRTVVTICHEAGHAVAALVVGRRLSGIRVHSDTSGLTLTRGRPGGVGMAVTFFFGYPAASLFGLGVAALTGAGHAAGALWLIVVLLGAMLLMMRNFYGMLAVLVVGSIVALASWYAPGPIVPWLASGVAWLLLLAGPRPVFEVAGNRHPRTDGAQLAALTHVPRIIWVGLWVLVCLGSLVGGALLMLPGVRG